MSVKGTDAALQHLFGEEVRVQRLDPQATIRQGVEAVLISEWGTHQSPSSHSCHAVSHGAVCDKHRSAQAVIHGSNVCMTGALPKQSFMGVVYNRRSAQGLLSQ